jgi:hypothetical protein
LEAFARNLQDGLIVKNYHATQDVKKTTESTHVQVQEIYEGITAMDQAVRGLDDQYQRIDSNIVELKDFISEQINDALASKNGMFQMLKDVVSGKVACCPQEDSDADFNSVYLRRAATRAYYELYMDHLCSVS